MSGWLASSPVFRDAAFQRRYYGALMEAGLPE
jgi:hypothetical protein